MLSAKPDPKVIESMAFRYRHDFGLLPEDQKRSIRGLMTQLWEEAVIRGGTCPKLSPISGVAVAQEALWNRYCMSLGKHEIAKLSIRDAFMMGCWMAYTYWRARTESSAI